MLVNELKYIESFDVEASLRSRDKKAHIINELRHKAINYDQVLIHTPPEDYPSITEKARSLVDKIIEKSSLTKYEKYLFLLHNKKWNFYKKSSINYGKQDV